MIFVAVYVDDILIFTNNKEAKKSLKIDLMHKFKMRDIGEVSSILGMNVERDRQKGILTIDQSHYISEVLERFRMHDCNPVSSPMDHNQKLTADMCPATDEERAKMKDIPFQEAIGSIMFAAQVTRPDICFAVNAVSRYIQNPGNLHWMAVKRILRYLKGTIGKKLVFNKSLNSLLSGFCDADWASEVDQRRSTTGYVFLMQGAAVSWNSRRQATVALSTTEAEYMSMAAAVQESIWLRQLKNELLGDNGAIMLYCDNKSAIDLAATTKYHARSKHIDIRYHFIRDKVTDNTINLNYIKTDDMIADMLTKAIVPIKQLKFSKLCGLK